MLASHSLNKLLLESKALCCLETFGMLHNHLVFSLSDYVIFQKFLNSVEPWIWALTYLDYGLLACGILFKLLFI